MIPERLLSFLRYPLSLAMLSLACAATPAMSATQTAEIARTDVGKLQVGMDYVVPAFIPGSKVRTPETIDTALAEALAARLSLSLEAVPVAIGVPNTVPGHEPDVILTVASEVQPAAAHMTSIPTGYTIAPMAIMRTDTDIRSWGQLKERTVCVAEGGRYVGTLSARYGAKEMVFRAPADALLALRIGECDAAVHDEVMLNALLELPEWKKFSATLVHKNKAPLVFLVPTANTAMVSNVKQLTKRWHSKRHLAALTRSRADDIAFEVYLDQVVADCH